MSFLLGILLSTVTVATAAENNCDQQAIAYTYKNGCIVHNDAAQCLLSASAARNSGNPGMVGAASYVAATVKGLTGNAAFEKSFEKKLARLEVLNSLERLKVLVQNEANKQVASTPSSDRKKLEIAKNFLNNNEREKQNVDEFRKIFSPEKAVDVTEGSFDKQMKAIETQIAAERKNILKTFFPEDTKFKNIFAEYEKAVEKETARLEERDFVEEKNRLRRELKKAQEGKSPEEQERIRQRMQAESDSIDKQEQQNRQALEEVRKNVADTYTAKNPKLAFLLKIQELSKFDFHIGQARAALGSTKPLTEFEKARLAEAKAEARTRTGLGVGGIGVGTAVSLGIHTRGQFDVSACKEKLGLSDDEVKFLKGSALLAAAKASRQGIDCQSMVLENPKETVEEAIREYGSVPPGVCKIIQNHDKKLDDLIGNQTMAPVTSCEGYKDTNVQVTKDDKFQYSDGPSVFKTDYIKSISYPNFSVVKVYDKEGNEKKKDSLEWQGKYNRIHPANVANPDRAGQDFATVCREGDTGFYCPMIQGAARARIAMSIANVACGRNPDGTPAGTEGRSQYEGDGSTRGRK